MAKFVDWVTSIEAQDIATKLQVKLPTFFATFDLSKIAFLTLKKKGNVSVQVVPTKFPYDIQGNYVYFVQIYDNIWNSHTKEQKTIDIFKALNSIEPQGFDQDSNKYACLRRRDVNEYSEVLAAVVVISIGIDLEPMCQIFSVMMSKLPLKIQKSLTKIDS